MLFHTDDNLMPDRLDAGFGSNILAMSRTGMAELGPIL
jgi:hypothetical protein